MKNHRSHVGRTRLILILLCIALAAAMLSERHRTQLSYYAAALARICGRRPDATVIYSLPLGGTVDVDVDVI